MAMVRLTCVSVIFLLFHAVVSSAAISQFFDRDGNAVRSWTGKKEGVKHAARQPVPDGIEMQKDITYEYYPVFGKTFTEIVVSVAENSPSSPDRNLRLPSKIIWHIGWTYDFSYSYALDEDSRFLHIFVELHDITIDYDITITLPGLLDDSALNPVEKTLWKNYFSRVLQHEHDHVRIIRDPSSRETLLKGFSDISYFIIDYRENIDIEKILEASIREETSKAGREWIKKIRERSDDYDRATDYGRKHEMRDSFFEKKSSD